MAQPYINLLLKVQPLSNLSKCNHQSQIFSLLTANDRWQLPRSTLIFSITLVGIIFCLWAVQMSRVKRRVSHFGAGIVWRTIPSGSPVFWIFLPGCSRNDYVLSPNLWVQKKLVKLWQGTQDRWICPAKFFWEFLSYSAFDFLRNLRDVILSQFRVKRVLSSTVSSTFRCFSLKLLPVSSFFLTLPWD